MGLQGGGEGVVTAAHLNAETLAAALVGAPRLFVDTYRQRGKQLSFGADK